MKFQPHIDGLRAIAVLAVVADHLGYRLLSGGYVGVDVFFVISGYLITGLMLQDLNERRHNLARFYERRARRILPALMVMLFTLLLVGWFMPMFPGELASLAGSALAALMSVANVLFWTQTGYFDVAASQKPLLHTWSLGVEEQFYLLYPVLLALLFRWKGAALGKMLAWTSAGLCALGIAWAAWDADSAFYLLPARAWELTLGAAVAVAPTRLRWNASVLAVAGLAGILVPALTYTHATPFLGLAAVPVCMGTAALLLLRDHPAHWGARLLSLPLAAFFGRISYSLYLWHWPVIVLQKNTNLFGLAALEQMPYGWHLLRLAEFTLSVLLATLSYRFVETPFRRTNARRRLLVFIGVAFVALAMACTAVLWTQGGAWRFPARVAELESYLNDPDRGGMNNGACMLPPGARLSSFDLATCTRFSPDRANVLVFGDSHAGHLWHGLDAAMPHAHIMQATALGCRPLLLTGAADHQGCGDLVQQVYRQILPDKRPDLLVLSGRWTVGDLPALKQSLVELRRLGVNTVLVGPSVEYAQALPRLLAQEVMQGRTDLALNALVEERFTLDRTMSSLAAEVGTPYFSMTRFQCPTMSDASGQHHCTAVIDGVPAAFDYGHLTRAASLHVGRAIASAHEPKRSSSATTQ